MDKTRTIEAIIKITERCNIDCTYCYVFNKGDDSYLRHPPYISKSTIEHTAKYLAKGAKDYSAKTVVVDFHGGEPCLMKKHRFAEMCEILKTHIEPVCELSFNLQTNAMLIDSEWIEIFSKYNIGVGISLDGPEEVNDKERIDHRGRGTYHRTVAGMTKLKEAWDEGLIKKIGLLAVLNPTFDAKVIYRHFVHDLKLDWMNFLLPIDSHDAFDKTQNKNIAKSLCDIFDEWVYGNDPQVNVRIINQSLGLLRGGAATSLDVKTQMEGSYAIITIASNGDIEGDDTLRPLSLGIQEQYNVATSNFIDFMNSKEIKGLQRAEHTLPDDCKECCWQNICRGGAAHGRLINRYSLKNGFNNSSIICDALKEFYSHVSAHLLTHAITFEELTENLLHNDIDWYEYENRCEFSTDNRNSISVLEIA